MATLGILLAGVLLFVLNLLVGSVTIPLSSVEELLSETPFHVSQATKQDLKVLEAKHIPFVKLKP